MGRFKQLSALPAPMPITHSAAAGRLFVTEEGHIQTSEDPVMSKIVVGPMKNK